MGRCCFLQQLQESPKRSLQSCCWKYLLGLRATNNKEIIVGDYPNTVTGETMLLQAYWHSMRQVRPETSFQTEVGWGNNIAHTKIGNYRELFFFSCTEQSLRVWRFSYRTQGPHQRLESEHVLCLQRLWPDGKWSNRTFERSKWWTQPQSVSDIRLFLIPLLWWPPFSN